MTKARDIEFTVSQLNRANNQLLVVGRCCSNIIKVGDVFNSVYRYTPAKSPEDYARPGEREGERQIALQIEKIYSYQRYWEELHPGLTAELTLFGEGGELVREGDMLGGTTTM